MKSEVDRLRFGLDRLAPTVERDLHSPSADLASDGRHSPDFAAV